MSSPSDFDVVVLGAGVVGINSAYWLARAGKSVCVIDRQCAAGLETSFANGGQISVSHAEPWANPSAPLKVLKWLMHGDSPLLFRPTLDVHQWLWLAQFMIDCLPGRADRHTTEIVKLATASRVLLQEIRAREQLDYDQRTRGILHFYRDPREFESAIRVAELMRTFGCDRRVISTEEVVELEPAFEACRRDKLVYSNLGGRLRVAGTAELSGYDLRLNHRRCRAIVDNVRKTFPQAGDFDAAQFWTGLRPATPSNLPYVGRANGYRNLWLNTGHGTLGWTLAAGSGRLVSDLICDQPAEACAA